MEPQSTDIAINGKKLLNDLNLKTKQIMGISAPLWENSNIYIFKQSSLSEAKLQFLSLSW